MTWSTGLLATELSETELASLLWVLLASALAAFLSRVHRRVVLPTVVVEIVLGILLGPDVLDRADVNTYLVFLSNVGLSLLFFLAGVEVVENRVPRSALRRGTVGWGLSVAIGLVVGAALQLAGVDAEWWLLGIALCTTALGTLVPILVDAGVLLTPLGRAVLGTGVAGEFWPIIVVSVFLTGVYGAAAEVVLLIGFGVLVLAAATVALRARPPRALRVLQDTIHTTGQAAVRTSMFLLGALVYLAAKEGFEFVLGAFAAGVVVGLVLDSPEGKVVRLRLEGIGFGFLIPIYFVVTGITFDIDSLLTPSGMALAALFLSLMLVTRGASALLWIRDLERREVAGLAFLGGTGLPLIVAIVGIGTERGAVTPAVGASLIGAGMISVLVYPLLAMRIARLAPGQRSGEAPEY